MWNSNVTSALHRSSTKDNFVIQELFVSKDNPSKLFDNSQEKLGSWGRNTSNLNSKKGLKQLKKLNDELEASLEVSQGRNVVVGHQTIEDGTNHI